MKFFLQQEFKVGVVLCMVFNVVLHHKGKYCEEDYKHTWYATTEWPYLLPGDSAYLICDDWVTVSVTRGFSIPDMPRLSDRICYQGIQHTWYATTEWPYLLPGDYKHTWYATTEWPYLLPGDSAYLICDDWVTVSVTRGLQAYLICHDWVTVSVTRGFSIPDMPRLSDRICYQGIQHTWYTTTEWPYLLPGDSEHYKHTWYATTEWPYLLPGDSEHYKHTWYATTEWPYLLPGDSAYLICDDWVTVSVTRGLQAYLICHDWVTVSVTRGFSIPDMRRLSDRICYQGIQHTWYATTEWPYLLPGDSEHYKHTWYATTEWPYLLPGDSEAEFTECQLSSSVRLYLKKRLERFLFTTLPNFKSTCLQNSHKDFDDSNLWN